MAIMRETTNICELRKINYWLNKSLRCRSQKTVTEIGNQGCIV